MSVLENFFKGPPERRAGWEPGKMFKEMSFELDYHGEWIPAYAYSHIVGPCIYNVLIQKGTRDSDIGDRDDIPPLVYELHEVTSREAYWWLGANGRNFDPETVFEEQGNPPDDRPLDPTRFVEI